MGLFTPKWKHANPEIRKQAVIKLKKEDVRREIALNDESPDVRKAAISGLISVGALETILLEDPGSAIRETAQQRINSLAADTSIDPGIRVHAIPLLSHPPTLEKIAHNEKDEALRRVAMMRISDQKTLVTLAKKESDRRNKVLLYEMIEGEKACYELYKKEVKADLRRILLRKISNEDLLQKIYESDDDAHNQRIALTAVHDESRLSDMMMTPRGSLTATAFEAQKKNDPEEAKRLAVSRGVMGITDSNREISIRHLRDQKLLRAIALNDTAEYGSLQYNFWERLAAIDTLEDQQALLEIAIQTRDSEVSLFQEALSRLYNLPLIEEALKIKGMDSADLILLKLGLKDRRDVALALAGDDGRFLLIYGKLMALMDKAYPWGEKNGWPLMEKYPQYKQLRELGKQLYALDKEAAMQKACDMSHEWNENYAGMLNFIFKGIGDWMA